MSNLTAQRVRTVAGQQESTEQVLSTASWSKVFPSKVDTERKSCTFVKKLLTVGISNITYLRGMFPEDAYARKSLDKFPVQILKQKTVCDKATVLAGWILGAFDALEKKYLKKLMLVVYLDPATPDTVHEMYTFKFSYPSGFTTCEVQGRDRLEAKAAQDDMYRSTRNLLQTLVVLTQGLGPLPASAYLALKLTYYDEVTPADYEPAGFCATELTELQFPSGVQRQKTGKVATPHHTVGLQLLAGPAEIVGEDIIETSNVDHDDLFSVRRRRGCVIPPLLLPPSKRSRQFANNPNLMQDPMLIYERKFVDLWTDVEKAIFREKYLEHPKNFTRIAANLEQKTVQDCVQYYYLSKKKTGNYKFKSRRVRRGRKDGRAGAGQNSRQWGVKIVP
jgi:meiosis-specific protein HOP1